MHSQQQQKPPTSTTTTPNNKQQRVSPQLVLIAIMVFGVLAVILLSGNHHHSSSSALTSSSSSTHREDRTNEEESDEIKNRRRRRREEEKEPMAIMKRNADKKRKSINEENGLSTMKKIGNAKIRVKVPKNEDHHHKEEEEHDEHPVDEARDRAHEEQPDEDHDRRHLHEHENDVDDNKAVEKRQKMIRERELEQRNEEAMIKKEKQTQKTTNKKNKDETSNNNNINNKDKKVWEEYSFSNSKDKADLHPDNNNHQNNNENEKKNTNYLFDLDHPRAADEAAFVHRPKSAGGKLEKPPSKEALEKLGKAPPTNWTDTTFELAESLYHMFNMYDEDEDAKDALAVYGTMCIGKDCEFIVPMIKKLDVSLGHFIVVLSTETQIWVDLFSALMRQFPGRFTVFHRPEKLSCAESWNLVTRVGFAYVKPMPDQIVIANADWHPIPTKNTQRNMARFVEWSRNNLDKVLNRYYHFSSFAFTQKGYKELGYFDEVIYPALAEDVEFHLKAVSKGLGTLGLYDNWSSGSKHIHRASAGEKTVQKRHGSVARFDYVLRKWGIRVPNFRDFALARPYSHPFNLPWMSHNNSFVVDPKHRHCAKTGDGEKFSNTNRCFYDPSVLMKLFPKEGYGDPEQYQLPKGLMSRRDNFPGSWH